MGNCFSADDSSPQNSTHLPPPEEDDAGGVVSNYNFKPRSIASADTSPLNSAAMDPKLVSLLNFFKQLERRKEELFKVVIPVHGDEILDVFRRIRKDDEKIGRKGLKRSHSAGAAGAVARGVDLSNGGEIKLERFKVKTLDLGDPPKTTTTTTGGGKGGGGKK